MFKKTSEMVPRGVPKIVFQIKVLRMNAEADEQHKIALALFDFSGERKNPISLKKEDLLMVVPSSKKWLYAEKDDKMGFVPFNYVSIFEDVLCEKIATKDYNVEEENSLSFSKGDQVQIFKEKMGWGIGKAGNKYGYFPLKYVSV